MCCCKRKKVKKLSLGLSKNHHLCNLLRLVQRSFRQLEPRAMRRFVRVLWRRWLFASQVDEASWLVIFLKRRVQPLGWLSAAVALLGQGTRQWEPNGWKSHTHAHTELIIYWFTDKKKPIQASTSTYTPIVCSNKWRLSCLATSWILRCKVDFARAPRCLGSQNQPLCRHVPWRWSRHFRIARDWWNPRNCTRPCTGNKQTFDATSVGWMSCHLSL